MSNLKLVQKIDEAKRFVNCEYLDSLSYFRPVPLPERERGHHYIRIYHILKVVHGKNDNSKDKLASIFNAVMPFCDTLALLIKGNPIHTDLYIGVRSKKDLSISADILHDSMIAHFPGSLLKQVSDLAVDSIFSLSEKNVGCLNILPSTRKVTGENPAHGIERFIDIMRGKAYICEILASPCSNGEIDDRISGFEDLYTSLSPFVKQTVSNGRNAGQTITDGFSNNISLSISKGMSKASGISQSHSHGVSSGFNYGMNFLFGVGMNTNTSDTFSNGTSSSTILTDSKAIASAQAEHTSTSSTSGITNSVTIEWQCKSIEELLKTIDSQISRLQDGKSFGMWKTAAYFLAPKRQDVAIAANTFRSLVTGDQSGTETGHFNMLDQEQPGHQRILEALESLVHPVFELPSETGTSEISPVTLLNGSEIPLLFSVPEKSVAGLEVSSIPEFGRNIPVAENSKSIQIGHVFHMGQMEPAEISLNLQSLASHCFVTGSTGSGKSNTVYQILESISAPGIQIPFLVIEPAKGEYRDYFRNLEGISLFSTNPRLDELLKLNPFSFSRGIHVLEHLDRLIEIFKTCWEMYAAMPAILKDALEAAYVSKGWDLINSVYMYGGEPEFPTFFDVLRELPGIINRSQYSAETKGDYIGSLVTRVNSLTNGIYGQIFCDEFEIDNRVLFDHPSIVDLSRVGSSETKSLIMGVIILKLNEYRMSEAGFGNTSIRHITVLEEAHHILKSTKNIAIGSGSSVISKSVEMIVNSIAEMRTYGEGFIVVDQSPTSVDIAAIKNTNTKIIMRLPEREDGILAGHSIALNMEQEEELSRLGTGIAVVMQNNWERPVLAKIEEAAGKYTGYTKEITHTQVKSLQNIVIADLLDQFVFSDRRDTKLIRSHITSQDIALSKKKELLRCVNSFEKSVKSRGTFDSPRFGRLMMRLSGCGDAFRRCEALLLTDQKGTLLLESVLRWKITIREILTKYVTLDELHENAFLQYILYAKRHESQETAAKYEQLYSELYSLK